MPLIVPSKTRKTKDFDPLTSLLECLASGAKEMARLDRTNISLPSQFASHFLFNKTFAVSPLPTSYDGVLFFGSGPYKFLLNTDAFALLIYTNLYINPVSTASAYTSGDASTEYFIKVNSINVNNEAVPIKKSFLSINGNGYGGTKISTVNPYTIMETSIYKAVTEAFVKAAAAMNITRVGAVSPFGVCFSSQNVGSTRVGPAVPSIDLVLENEVSWTIFGSNSMVQVSDNVLCLGFLDGGSKPRTSIVIDGYQLEDNLLQFDLANSKLAFGSALFFSQITCSNFNFTSSA